MIVDYSYYHDTYKGNLVPETSFDRFSLKAQQKVMMRILGRDFSDHVLNVKNAICEIIEIYYNQKLNKDKMNDLTINNNSIITSEKVGDYSRSYGNVNLQELKSVTGEEYIESEINDSLERNLLLTGLLFQGIIGV